ncbi:MAG: hypothetical protein M1834_008386 [Cirrosporium novae-zelandiae]|nr:MAG: hypothetical protein M1834_008386 [Cirrosporium novae-zelandiae]
MSRTASATSKRNYFPTAPSHSSISGSNVNGSSSLYSSYIVENGFVEISDDSSAEAHIIAIPAVGADPIETWASYPKEGYELRAAMAAASVPALMFTPPAHWSMSSPNRLSPGTERKSFLWITELKGYIPKIKVHYYDHETLSATSSLDQLAIKLLENLRDKRKSTGEQGPMFFVCHSTGGLVAKAALVLAAQPGSNFQSILCDCYGITFFATPHNGSSYLSSDEYADSIARVMRLKSPLPTSLRKSFDVRSSDLCIWSESFRDISTEFKIWNFLETVDTQLTMKGGASSYFRAPITSINSGILDLEQEYEVMLASDHVDVATFAAQEDAFHKESYVKQLKSAVEWAIDLSKKPSFPLNVKDDVHVEVHGFFENADLGVSESTPLKLWSSRTTLQKFLDEGPAKVLKGRVNDYLGKRDSLEKGPSPDRIGPHSQGAPNVRHGLAEDPPPLQSPRITIKEPTVDGYDFRINSPSLDNQKLHILADQSISGEPQDMDTEMVSAVTPRIEIGEYTSETFSPSQDPHLARNKPTYKNPQYQKDLHDRPKPFKLDPGPRLKVKDLEQGPRIPSRFPQPQPENLKFTWIHVPYTHAGWVPEVLHRVCKEANVDGNKYLLSDDNWNRRHNTARHPAPHARYIKSGCIHKNIPPSFHSQMALYVGILHINNLHWDTYKNLLRSRKIIERRIVQGRTKPVPEDISGSKFLEGKLIWSYLGSHPPIHCRRTLDQFGYPNLRSTIARDDDQMLWKRTKKTLGENAEHQAGEEVVDGNVLMVDQLWLYVIDNKTVVTFFPKKESTFSEGNLYQQADLRDSIYNELNGDLARRCETCGDFAALLVLHAITVLLERTLHRDLQILRIFEESISILTETMTRSFKRFRTNGFSNTPEDFIRNPNGSPMTLAEQASRDQDIAKQNRKDLATLLELRDIVDELSTIMKLFEQQDIAIRGMESYCTHVDCRHGIEYIKLAEERLEKYKSQVEEMKKSAMEAQQSVSNLLDLKQKQANVDEARMARWQADVSQHQSRSVMIFTIFTVIFLPLSFFTSLFGMNARDWSGSSTNLSLQRMIVIAGPVSVAIIAFALFMAFSGQLRYVTVATKKILSGLCKDILVLPLKKMLRLEKAQKKFQASMPMSIKRLDKYLKSEQQGFCADDDFWTNIEDDKHVSISETKTATERTVPYHTQPYETAESPDSSSKTFKGWIPRRRKAQSDLPVIELTGLGVHS